MGPKKYKLTFFTLAVLISACQTPNTFNNKPLNPVLNQVTNKTVLKGIVEFPDLNKYQKGLKTKSSIDSIKSNATVSIINPANNNTIGSGLTDDNGAFTINPSGVTINNNDIFILEALKRSGTSKANIVSIRTYIKRVGSTWQSITFPDIKINSNTTALSVIEDLNSNVNPEDLINTIDTANSNNFTPFGSVTQSVLDNVSEMVKYVLATNSDPFKMISFENNNYLVKENIPILKLNNLSGNSGLGGTEITISGTGFSTVPEKNIVTFMLSSPVTGTVTASSDTQLTVTVPEIPGQTSNLTGKVKVDVFGNSQLSINDFTVLKPAIINTGSARIMYKLENDIAAIDLDGTNFINLTDGFMFESRYPSWAPDGEKIGFAGCTSSLFNANCTMFMADPDGSNRVQLTTAANGLQGKRLLGPPYFQPSGNKVAFRADVISPERFDVYLLDNTGNNVVNISSGLTFNYNYFSDRGSPWSNNGQKLAFTSNRLQCCARDIYMVNSAGTGRINLTQNIQEFPEDFIWYPDNTNILITAEGKFFKVNTDNNPPTFEQLFSDTEYNFSGPVALSPDGTKISFPINNNGEYELYIANSDGTGTPVLVTPTDHIYSMPPYIVTNGETPTFTLLEYKWSPDSSKIAFIVLIDVDGNSYYNMYSLDVNSPETTYLLTTENMLNDQSIGWSSDSTEVIFAEYPSDIKRVNWDGSGSISNITDTEELMEYNFVVFNQ
jgi:hypothetical protein